ncbi:MAG: SDR family NAD(P)-dependent oxidoreductase [Candidatus Omnitrophica bacterium]|nr:SDR family NAD(P)-dependent oxidoreductase [Candidatus Omnitrophota bacterium]
MENKNILITGGAGFIGVNLAKSLLEKRNSQVIVYDNLSRKGVENNLQWLRSQKYKNLKFIKGDVRDYKKLKEAVKGCGEVYHLAAQVAVTSSVEDPIEDFGINAEGALYVLEAVRKLSPGAVFIFTSTNKVYGELLHLKLKEGKTRYILTEKKKGVSEAESLDFHSPYGCSKGTADQYVRDYYRIYGLKTVVFRQSCIYGEHQYGNEDQGWVAHFIIKSLLGRKINIYGDGKQIRDLLEVSDLIRAYGAALRKIDKAKGEIYNIGGGAENAFSLLELIAFLKKEMKKEIEYDFDEWRPGDQKVFISDNTKLKKELGWSPSVSKEKGIRKLIGWIENNIDIIKRVNKG